MAEIVHRHYLTCVDKAKNQKKFYDIRVEKDGKQYTVKATYGRLGTSGRTITKATRSSQSAAMSVANRLKRDKERDKGYKVAKAPAEVGKKKRRRKKEPPLTSSRISLKRFKFIME